MPLIQAQVVDIHHWLTMTEFVDIVTISQMTPGPIAINAATFVGTQVSGLLGAIIATLGCVVPSCIIVLTLAYFYFKYQNLTIVQGILSGLRPAVVALIGSAGLSILVLTLWGGRGMSLSPKDLEVIPAALFLLSLILLRWKKPNPILVMLMAGGIGMCVFPFLPQ